MGYPAQYVSSTVFETTDDLDHTQVFHAGRWAETITSGTIVFGTVSGVETALSGTYDYHYHVVETSTYVSGTGTQVTISDDSLDTVPSGLWYVWYGFGDYDDPTQSGIGDDFPHTDELNQIYTLAALPQTAAEKLVTVEYGADVSAIIVIREDDGDPTLSGIDTIVVTSGSLTDLGGGEALITTDDANQIRGRYIMSTAPTDDQVLRWDASLNAWAPDTISGTSQNHADLSNLDYASAGHTGFASTGYVDTVSGAISAEIDSDIATFSGTIDHDTINNTHNLTTDIDHGSISGLTDDDHKMYSRVNGVRAFTSTVSGVYPTLDPHLATKEYVDDVVAQIIYTTSGIVLNTGTYVSGDVDSVGTLADGDYYIVDEVVGVPGYDIEFTCSGVATFSRVWVHVQYDGSGAHTVNLDLYNDDTTNWDTITTFTASAGLQFLDIPVANPVPYVADNGDTIVRLYHITSGNSAHTVNVDYVAVAQAGQGASTDHGALNGLDDDDHLQYHTDTRGDARYYTQTQVDTISGALSAEIDSDIATFSGTIDHNTINNAHNLTTDIDHDQLTNYAANEHFTWQSVSGTIDHNTINNTHNLTTDIDHDQLTNYDAAEHFYWATVSATIDHDTINNTHNLTTDIDHDALTNFAADEHFTWESVSGTIDHDTLVNFEQDEHFTWQSVSGTIDHDTLVNFDQAEHFTEGSIDHSNITNLDYASAGHTGFAQTVHTHTESQITDLEHDAVKIQTRTVSSGVPSQGQALVWNNVLSQWEPGNVAASGTNATQLQGYDIDSAAPQDGQFLVWDNNQTQWEPTTLSGIGITVTYDGSQVTISGGTGDATSIQGYPVSTEAPQDGEALVWDIDTMSYVPTSAIGVPAGDRVVYCNGIGGDLITYLSIESGQQAFDFGDSTLSNRAVLGGTDNGVADRGCFAGGLYNGAVNNTIDYITINVPSNATDFGDLTQSRQRLFSGICSNKSSQRGLFAGGLAAGAAYTDRIDYITVNSVGNATDLANLQTARYGGGCTSNGSNDRGVFGGGREVASAVDTIGYKTISTTANCVDFGNLTLARMNVTATSNSTDERGIFCGGESTAGTTYDRVDYITINSIGNATDLHNLTSAKSGCASGSNGVDDVAVTAGGSTDGSTYLNVVDKSIITSASNATNWGSLISQAYIAGVATNSN